MRMKPLLFCALILPLPAQSSDFWCVPDTVCVPGTCDIQINEESSIRLTHPDSMAPSLRSHGETIAMTKTFERSGTSQWNGVNSLGEHEALYLDRDRMEFIYWIGGETVRNAGQEVRYKAWGRCEEQ